MKENYGINKLTNVAEVYEIMKKNCNRMIGQSSRLPQNIVICQRLADHSLVPIFSLLTINDTLLKVI